jgi:hypothetical protein
MHLAVQSWGTTDTVSLVQLRRYLDDVQCKCLETCRIVLVFILKHDCLTRHKCFRDAYAATANVYNNKLSKHQ